MGNETESGDDKITIDCQKAAIADAQTTIRSYDTKAQILIGLLTICIGIIANNPKWMARPSEALIVAIFTAFLAMASCGLVLFPRRVNIPTRVMGGASPQNSFFVRADTVTTIAQLAQRMRETNWIDELAYELRKLAQIRGRKEFWFKAGLTLGSVALVSFYLVLMRGIG